jgi:hypothetical protein
MKNFVAIKALVLTVISGLMLSAAAAPGDPTGQWQVLVENEATAGSASFPAKWNTAWSDGRLTKIVDGFAISKDQQLWNLKVVAAEGQCSCKDGKFPFSYRVDQLVATKLSDPKASKVLLGDIALDSAKAVMRDHQASCEGIKALPGQPDSTESYERSRLRLLSNWNGSLGLESVNESFAYGRPVSMISNDWSAYRLDKDPISEQTKRYLPAGAATEATSKFLKLPAGERDPFSPGDFSHFVFVPAGGGVAVEFGVPGTGETVRKQARVVRVERPTAPNEEYEQLRHSFVAAHKGLVPWDKVGFYTIAPDRSAAVYAQNGNLYWQGLTGKAKVIAPVKNVRGWQWHHAAQ